jgi:prepilin-type processing-associated H-X9-DG protein
LPAAKDGFKFAAVKLQPHESVLIAEPLPGYTGSESALLRVGFAGRDEVTELRFFPTPNADLGAAKRETDVAMLGAQAISCLTRLLPFIEQEPVYEMTPGALRDPENLPGFPGALRGLLNDSGDFSLASFQEGGMNFAFGDGSVRMVFQDFTREMAGALRLGAYGEDWMGLEGVSPNLPAVQSPLFNFAVLESLTEASVPDGILRHSLLIDLQLAEDAAAKGKTKQKARALGDYVATLERAAGATLPAVQTQALIQIAKTL